MAQQLAAASRTEPGCLSYELWKEAGELSYAMVERYVDADAAQAHRLAVVAHDGLARAVNPVHTMSDGDSLFALGTACSGKSLGMMTLSTLAAEAVAVATARAVLLAQSVRIEGQATLPSYQDLQARS